MAIAPADGQKFAAAIRAYYDNVENTIMEKIAARIAKDGEEPDSSHWLQKKLGEVQRHKSEIDGIIRKLAKEGPEAITQLVMQGYLSGMISADGDLDKRGADMLEDRISANVNGLKEPAEIVSGFGRTHVAAIASIVAENLGGLQGAHMKMLRSAQDAYKTIIMDVAQSGIAGVDTRKQATQRALNKFADKGIGAFTDKTGKEWDIGTYAEMATRTSMAHAHVQGHINRMTQQGHDLVVVSSHPEPSHLCEPHQHQVYSISGNLPRFKPLKRAINRGLFHPNCHHTINAWIESLSDEPPAVKADPEGYKLREHQRKLERKIKDWKKRQVVAVNPKDKAFANEKVKYWQSEMRAFTKATGRRRHYTREQINARVVGLPAAPAGAVKSLPAAAKVVPFKQIVDTAAAKVQKDIKPAKADVGRANDFVADAKVIKSIRTKEEKIKGLDHERGAIYDLNGNVVWEKKGGANSVDLTIPWKKGLLDGNIFTHNHPNGQSFSVGDVDIMLTTDLREMRAVTANGDVARMIRTGPKVSKKRMKEIEDIARKEAKRIAGELRVAMVKKEITKEQANAEQWHREWTKLAPEIGIRYER